MTIETAIRVKEILTELESISAKRDLFENYYDMDIEIVDVNANGMVVESFDCHKGGQNTEFFSYIIDGLNYKIEELKLELARM